MENKTIWMYWHQGFSKAPELVNRCVNQWQLLHPNWTVQLLDKINYKKFIASMPISDKKLDELSLAHRSDLLRTQLLIEHGGVWADPTCFPVIPLDDWLPEYMNSGLFLFYRPGRDRIISNWFIASEKDNMILKKLLLDLCYYWENNTFLNLKKKNIWYEPFVKKVYNLSLWSTGLWFTWFTQKVLRLYPYMVYHYKFYQLITKDSECKNIWKKIPKISADGPHRLQRIGLSNTLTNEAKEIIDQNQTPLFKLSWKTGGSDGKEDSVLGYLFSKYNLQKWT